MSARGLQNFSGGSDEQESLVEEAQLVREALTLQVERRFNERAGADAGRNRERRNREPSGAQKGSERSYGPIWRWSL